MSSTTPNETDWEDVLLHVVTGKGGTGKTTVAAALALALAAAARRVLLCEVEGRQGIAQLFDVPPLPYEERKIAAGPDGGEVYALAIEPEAALLEYLDMFYKLGRAGQALDELGAIDFATTIAPGVRDVLLTGKVYEAAYRNSGARAPAGTTRSCSTRRRPAGSPASSTSTARWRAWPRSARSRTQADSVMPRAALPADRGAPGDAAGGDAGAGDRGRHRRAARREAARRRGGGEHGAQQRARRRGPRPGGRGRPAPAG